MGRRRRPRAKEEVAAPVLRHRLILNYEAEAAVARPDGIVADALERVREQ